MTKQEKDARIEILKTRIRAAEEAWRWCRENGRRTTPASREMHAAIQELKAIESK